MTTALERLRQTMASDPERAFVSFVSSSDKESETFHTLGRKRVEKGEEVTNLLINKETTPHPPSPADSHTCVEGTDKTDKSVAALCVRCSGEPVHLCCGA
jgi:hypothetical protein